MDQISVTILAVAGSNLSGNQQRMSHADVVSSIGDVEPEEKKGIKLALFNAVGGAGAFKPADEIVDCDLADMRPAKLG